MSTPESSRITRQTVLEIPSLLYLERYRNEGTRNYSRHAAYSEAGEEYRPTSEVADFTLPVYELPRREMNVYTAHPPSDLASAFLPKDSALFCIHPQVLAACGDDPYVRRTLELSRRTHAGMAADAPLRVSATSSTRTLFVLNPAVGLAHFRPHSLKVHFPFRVSRYGRRMRDEVVEQAIAVSTELETWMRTKQSTEAGSRVSQGAGFGTGSGVGFAFLREVIGVTQKNLDPDTPRGENWGYLVRDMVPVPVVEDERALVPGFALYGRDYFNPEETPLIMDLADPGDPAGWILENVLLPIVRHWVACFRELGLVLEPHGQNVLLEIDAEGRVLRVVHRDLSVAIDMRRRRDLEIPNGSLNDYNRMESGAFNSIAYDKFMGGHFFDSLLEPLLEQDPTLSMEDFRRPVRDVFDGAFPEHERYVPRTVHYFSEDRDRFGKPLYQDTGRAPQWRP